MDIRLLLNKRMVYMHMDMYNIKNGNNVCNRCSKKKEFDILKYSLLFCIMNIIKFRCQNGTKQYAYNKGPIIKMFSRAS